MTRRRLALRGTQLAVSIGLLAYLFSSVPIREVLSALIGAQLTWLAGGFALVGATNLMASVQMRAILSVQGMKFTLPQVAGINLITKFYGLFLPSYLAGGVIRWHHFSRPEGKRAQALAAMIFSREVELITTIAFGIAFWFLATATISALSVVTTLLAALAGAISIVLLSLSPTSHKLIRYVLSRLPIARRSTERVSKVSACLVEYGRRGHGHHLRFLLLCIARNAIGVLAFVAFARAVGIAAPAVDLGWVRAALDLVLILPVSVAGLGVRDASLVTMLGHLGVSSSTALAFSFLLLARTLFVALLGGIVEGLRIGFGIAPGLAATHDTKAEFSARNDLLRVQD